MIDYKTFLDSKAVAAAPVGFEVAPTDLHQDLFGFQRDIVAWALRRGRAALFCDCGLGKTLMQLEWARHVCARTGGDVLILAPLAVAEQTVAEGLKFGIVVVAAESQADVTGRPGGPWIYVTNYEKLHLFEPDHFAGVVLDESSILKAYMGKTKQALVAAFAHTHYKLACTATPAPNDTVELGNHAEFLGIMEAGEMLTRWFINDSKRAQNLRLKGHGEGDFWRWLSTWAVCLCAPSDMADSAGIPYSDEGFSLPPLSINEHPVRVDWSEGAGDRLFRLPALGATEMHREMRLTCEARALRAAELVLEGEGPCVVWCNTNYEADAVMAALRGSMGALYESSVVEVRGADSNAEKARKLGAFSRGEVPIIVSKPTLAGFGLNWQHCARCVFVGLSYSFEQLYQAIRRCWRFGQLHPVQAHLVVAETEAAIAGAVRRKQEEHRKMQEKMGAAMRATRQGLIEGTELAGPLTVQAGAGVVRHVSGAGYDMYEGDCVEVLPSVPADSVGLSIWSPPFSSLYTYTPSLRDMGNCEGDDQFFEHFSYLLPALWRVTIPGRLAAVHCKNLPMYKSKYGASGLRDFRGDVIRAFREARISDDPADRWVYHSEVCIWKDPVREMQRTKTQGLLYKQVRADASHSRQGLPDYLVVFRKWTADCDAPDPITHDTNSFPLEVWQRYASPVWFDIDPMDVLNERLARGDKDEKHICPLQLGVIERAVELWTNPGDLVLSPFAGIGSEGYMALKQGRRFLGVELKPAYFDWAVRNIEDVIFQEMQPNFLDLAESA